MTLTLQIVLAISSIITFLFVITKIRKAQLNIQDAVIWILLSLLLIVMTFCLPFITDIAHMLGFIGTSNFVFTLILAFLIIIVFGQSVKISILDEKIKNLNHYIALKEKRDEEKQ